MKIFIIGFGKMGKELARLSEGAGYVVHGIANNFEALKLNHKLLIESDVAIEFTNPDAVLDNVKYCLESGVPVVCGTTGWYQYLEAIKALCQEKNGTFFYASNFSIGVNIFFKINRLLANLLKDYEEYHVRIDEIHHIHKKDKPSGTAITLAEGILQEISRIKSWQSDVESPGSLNITSHRIDLVPGTHKVMYSSGIDDIEIIHTAHNRTGFASGALKAAAWIQEKKGCFTMDDLLSQP